MSIFKVKQWWSNEKSQTEKFDDGVQNANCIKVDKFNSYSDSDCIVIGQGSVLKIYKPNSEKSESCTILETHLNDVVLHIETGKFTVDSNDRQIFVLHPKSYAVYLTEKKSGHIEVEEQAHISQVIRHSFTRKAYSATCGPFGSSKSRDLICVQALDGTLSFFDQDTFLFMCMFDDIIIPGPISYIPSSDLFVICKSTWVLEIYSYQQLCEFSELNIRPIKNNIPQWMYNAGEEVLSIQVIRTSNNFSSIIALGERHLYCFQDNGLMKYMIRFDFMPICFHAYLIGWYYEPNSRLLVMIASEDSKLYVYEGTTLLWSCDLIYRPISISRCFLSALPGGLVVLATDGIVHINYLGTEPDLNANTNQIKEIMDPIQIQAELDVVEESLQKVMETKESIDINDLSHNIDRLIQFKINIGKPTNISQMAIYNTDNAMLQSSVVIMLTCEDPNLVQNVQITLDCIPPITSSETAICLDNINGTEIIETFVYLSGECDISCNHVKILFTILDNTGKINIISKTIPLPLSLYCVPVEVVDENKFKLSIATNKSILDFVEILDDFTSEELTSCKVAKNIFTLAYRTSYKTVTIKASENIYSIEANDVSDIFPIVDYFINKLKNCYNQIEQKFKADFKINGELIKQMIHKFLKSIEAHAKERNSLKSLEEELAILQRQFTLVQKRLLVQYGSCPPGDCEPLEFLMNDTHDRIRSVAQKSIDKKSAEIRAGSTVRAIGNLVIYILKEIVAEDFEIKLIEEVISLDTLNGYFQEWEEAVAQGSSYIINKILKKSERDKEKLAPVIDQDILSQVNIKKLLKQLRVIFERIIDNVKDIDKDKITRIEEFVEVI